MPWMDGFSAKNELRSKGMKCPFVFVTMLNLQGFSSSGEEGPVGYVHKMDLFNELKLAIHTVARGNSYTSRSLQATPGGEIPSKVDSAADEATRQGKQDSKVEELKDRARNIVDQVRRGERRKRGKPKK